MIQQEMLQYQKIESELNKIERELKSNKYFLQRKQLKALKLECEDNLEHLDGKAGELRNQLASARQAMEKIVAIVEEYSKEIKEIEDVDELNYLNKKLAEQTSLLNNIERDVKRILKDGEEIVAKVDEINANLPKIISGINSCNAGFGKVTEEAKPRVNELKQKQTELKKVIDPQLFAVYDKVSQGHIHPVFVPLKDECRCGGCQMEMPKAFVEAQMATKDYMRCEHCGRIIYKEQ